MNIDEHFDRVSKQNLKFQFQFVSFGQTSVAAARMSSDDASSVLMCW